jgi:vacuolar-type H+-ATPase subunit H
MSHPSFEEVRKHGYNKDQVDDWVNDALGRFQWLEREVVILREQAPAVSQLPMVASVEPAALPAPVDEDATANAAGRALLHAERYAEHRVAEADAEAERVIRRAQQEAAGIIHSVNSRIEAIGAEREAELQEVLDDRLLAAQGILDWAEDAVTRFQSWRSSQLERLDAARESIAGTVEFDLPPLPESVTSGQSILEAAALPTALDFPPPPLDDTQAAVDLPVDPPSGRPIEEVDSDHEPDEALTEDADIQGSHTW